MLPLSQAMLLALGMLLACSGATAADFSVRVEGQPPRLAYPAPPGANYILTVKVSGGEAASVVLSTSLDPGRRFPLTRVGASEFQVNLNLPEVVEMANAVGPSGAFHVTAESVDGAKATSVPINYVSPAKAPTRLTLSDADRRMTIYQRSSRAIPSSGGTLFVQLSDITAGQVNLSIRDGFGGTVVAETPVHKCDLVRLVLAEAEYAVQVDDLVNLLVGNDYAVVSVLAMADAAPQAISRLLKKIEDSGLVFVRNDAEMTAADFARWLEIKHTHSDERCVSVGSFIERIAARSSATDTPYLVILKNGDRIEAATWLREQAADDLAAEAKSPGATTKP